MSRAYLRWPRLRTVFRSVRKPQELLFRRRSVFSSDSEKILISVANLAPNHVHQNQWDNAVSPMLTYFSIDDPEHGREDRDREARIVTELARCSRALKIWKKTFDQTG